MIEVDRVMIEDLHIELIQMMENAGRNLARAAIDLFSPSHVTVCVGSGGNGGGGLVAARHLHNAGVAVTVVLGADRERFTPVPVHQLDIVEHMQLPIVDEASGTTDLLVDAVIGYSLRGAPRGRAAEVIKSMEANPAPTLSLDAPSGLDTSTGETDGLHIRADATLTLALPKVGLRGVDAVGDLFVADISVPASVYQNMGAGPAPDFSASTIVSIDEAGTQPIR
jgi:NAD(P)H-hydrate epimerase